MQKVVVWKYIDNIFFRKQDWVIRSSKLQPYAYSLPNSPHRQFLNIYTALTTTTLLMIIEQFIF